MLALAVGAVLAYTTFANDWHGDRVDWGSVPAWLSFAASVGTFAGIWVAYLNFRTTREHRRDDEASPARLLVIENVAVAYGGKYPTVTVTLRNVGSQTFSDVQVTGVTLCDLGCQQTHHDHWHERTHESHEVVRPNATLQSGWVLPVERFSDRATQRPEVQYEYTDGKGKRWRRLSNLEPERIPAKQTDRQRRQRFDDALAARPDGGNGNANIHINLAIGQVVQLEDDDEAETRGD
ncbi:hypothetical protein EEB19_05070 [Gordonia sp. OPL2]|nr:hypothetical protein EEB19_05070 [Gordonia sp. OPL2]